MKNVKSFIYLIIFITIIVGTFIGSYDYLIQKFENTANSKEFALDNEIISSTNFIQSLTIYGDDFFEHSTIENNIEFYDLLKYNPNLDIYTLDAIGGTKHEKIAGNLTGLGMIPDNGIKKIDLNLALNYNKFFSKFYYRLHDIAWIYYTSENNFISQYPWVPSKEFKFSESIKNMDFYTSATPQNNPLRNAVWSPVYLDAAGKGLMVTLSSPIYNKDTFMGVVSLDLTTSRLSEVLKCEYDGYLIDNTNSVIASNHDVNTDKEIFKISDLMKNSESYTEKINNMENNTINQVDNYYIYKTGFNDAPWTMIISVPVYLIINKALLLTSPVIFIVILLLRTFKEMDKRKKIEDKVRTISITDSLTGLKNRYFLDEIIDSTMTSSNQLSIIIFDLDHFKRVNDTWGHPTGDDVLKKTAKIANDAIRKEDILIRLGGEEFLILLLETNIIDAFYIAERVRNSLEEYRHPSVGMKTVSLGIVEKIEGESFNNLYKRADKALYIAKEGGRNRTVIYHDDTYLPIASIHIKWDNKLECGDMTIDEQHREIFEMGNSLLFMPDSNVNFEEVDEKVDLFLQKILDHFDYEERVQIKIGYPDYKEHAEIHKNIISKALLLKESFHKRELKSSEFLSFMLDDIIWGHVINEDMKFFPYIKN